MTPQRRIARTVTSPPLAPGFVGPGHLAAQLVAQEDFAVNDPFIMLMDDHLDIGERPQVPAKCAWPVRYKFTTARVTDEFWWREVLIHRVAKRRVCGIGVAEAYRYE